LDFLKTKDACLVEGWRYTTRKDPTHDTFPLVKRGEGGSGLRVVYKICADRSQIVGTGRDRGTLLKLERGGEN